MDKSHPGFNKNAEPFFAIIRQGLCNAVDGEHFWDTIAENAVFEFRYAIPGFTSRIEGRDKYMDWFAGYSIVLYAADNLRIHTATDGKTIIMEYEVHGTAPETGKPYDNRFCSIVTIKNRKISFWRDYMDSLAVTALAQ